MNPVVFSETDLSWMTNLPEREKLFNPLTDVSPFYKEDSELIEVYKLGNEYFSPMWGIKYLMGINIYPYQASMIMAMMQHKFPLVLMSRGGGKTFILAVFAVYYALMNPGTKIVLVSASFRQSKHIFNEIKNIYKQSFVLRELSDSTPTIGTDRCYYSLNGSSIVALPLGQGGKIRGERAHVTLADEFNSIPIEIFDVVIRGFSATQQDPFEKTRNFMMRKQKSIDTDMFEEMFSSGNKIVLSGTAGHQGETFHKIYKQYRSILANKVEGRAADYKNVLGDDFEEDIEVDYKEYCIVEYKYTELPPGMMDTRVIHSSRASMPKFLFDMEYNCIFADASKGFFKASEIKEATSVYPDGFSVLTKGMPGKTYVLGVDPARTTDRFAITVIELGQPNKVVLVWTCQNKKYRYATEKIRDLMRKFNIIGIAMDKGGGGYTVEELLQSKDLMKEGERKVFRYDEEQDEEAKVGLKILYMFDFTSSWIDDANVLLQKNIEDKRIMFPMQVSQSTRDEVEDALDEIRDLKKELISIEVSYTKTGKRHYDLMPGDLRNTEDVVRHKDRYSSLLLGNYIASRLNKFEITDPAKRVREKYHNRNVIGGWLEEFM